MHQNQIVPTAIQNDKIKQQCIKVDFFTDEAPYIINLSVGCNFLDAPKLMTDYIKKYIKTIRLNSFHPLCEKEIGQNAIKEFNFPPFIDASCRREPDFENANPSITALCRQDLFAPNLYPNDIVVYITVRGKWFQRGEITESR